MYTHNPPEQFSLVTRAESTCAERLLRALLGGVLSPGGARPPRRARCGRRPVRNSCLDVSCLTFGLCETLPTSSGVAQGCRLAW